MTKFLAAALPIAMFFSPMPHIESIERQESSIEVQVDRQFPNGTTVELWSGKVRSDDDWKFNTLDELRALVRQSYPDAELVGTAHSQSSATVDLGVPTAKHYTVLAVGHWRDSGISLYDTVDASRVVLRGDNYRWFNPAPVLYSLIFLVFPVVLGLWCVWRLMSRASKAVEAAQVRVTPQQADTKTSSSHMWDL